MNICAVMSVKCILRQPTVRSQKKESSFEKSLEIPYSANVGTIRLEAGQDQH